MRGLAVDDEPHEDASAPLDHDVAGYPPGLRIESVGGARGLRLDEAAIGRRPHFLVAGVQPDQGRRLPPQALNAASTKLFITRRPSCRRRRGPWRGPPRRQTAAGPPRRPERRCPDDHQQTDRARGRRLAPRPSGRGHTAGEAPRWALVRRGQKQFDPFRHRLDAPRRSLCRCRCHQVRQQRNHRLAPGGEPIHDASFGGGQARHHTQSPAFRTSRELA